MRLTRRGRVVAGGVVITFLWATFFGTEALNALVLSGAIALVGSWAVVRRSTAPGLRRRPIEPDEAGAPRPIELDVTVPPSLTGRVRETVSDDVRIVDDVDRLPITDGRVRYTAIAERRGFHPLGPATIEVTDPLGLVAEETETRQTGTLLTYPPVHPLRHLDRSAETLLDGAPTRERHEFDHLREYQRGDAVRDIDWKSSAKRAAEPLVVKEFVSETAAGNALIVGMSEPGGADAMASAVASIACHLLDRGVPVGIRTADERVRPAAGDAQRRAILTALARTTGGRVEGELRASASILVNADADGEVAVTMAGGRQSFTRMTGGAAAATDGGWNQ